MKSWFKKMILNMYSTHNENLLLLKDLIDSISINVYIDKLDNIVNKCNNIYHSTIKMKPVNVKSNTYIDASKEIHNNVPKFKIGDTSISKYNNIFAKGYTPN